VLVEESFHQGISVPAIVLSHEPVLASRIHHDIEGLVQILQGPKQLGAVEEEHVVIGHAVNDQ
jgi:hypothetical protein